MVRKFIDLATDELQMTDECFSSENLNKQKMNQKYIGNKLCFLD